jgi:predicted site-specific integrase-resolvase
MATEMSFITFSQAAQRLGVSIKVLTAAANSAKIKVAKTPMGEMIAEDDVAKIEKREKLWKSVKKLDGNQISMTDATARYPEINFASLERWVTAGAIRIIKDNKMRSGRGNKRMLNEADVAYTALLLREQGKRPGKRLFTPETLPPHLTGIVT